MDKRVFKLIACAGKEHLDCIFDYKNAKVQLSINVSKLNAREFIETLKQCLVMANNWEVDFQSFIHSCSPTFESFEVELYLRSCAETFTRQPVSFKTSKNENTRSIKFLGLEKLNKEITSIIEFESQSKTWAEMPPNILNSEQFVKEIKEMAEKLKVDCQVIDWTSLKKQGFNLMCAVGQNKKNSYLVVLRSGPKSSFKKLALVGKGICFDTGGLSLKTGNYMVDMKFDMSGAALMGSIFFALAKNKISQSRELIALLPISENLIGSESIKVDSVLKSFGGLSIEISNTDAEGRLLLVEAISYAVKKLKASEVMTIATLTGAVKYALGTKYAGVWSSSEEIWKKIQEFAEYSGDWMWRLPLDKSYLKEMKSKIADWKNSATTGAAGASRAAAFLAEFRDNKDFIHFDIANVSNTEDKNKEGLAPLFKTIYFYAKNFISEE